MNDRQSAINKGSGDQIQAGRDVVIVSGMSFEDVRGVVEEMGAKLRAELTVAAEATARERVASLEEKLMARSRDRDINDAFADPDFQYNILEAQRAAARSGRDEDIELLADILTERATAQSEPRLQLATRKALDAAGQLRQDTLTALTLLWYIIYLRPLGPDLDGVLAHSERQLSLLLSSQLPETDDWMWDLDQLDCVSASVGGLSNLKPFVDLWTQRYPGFFVAGWDADKAQELRMKLESLRIGMSSVIVSHPFDSTKYCLAGWGEVRFREIVAAISVGIDPSELTPVVDELVAENNYVLETSIWNQQLIDRWNASYPCHARANSWWKADLPVLQVTSTGMVLGYTSVKNRLNGETLPSLGQYIT